MEPTEVPPITVLDLGARLLEKTPTPYASLPADVPGSKIIAVDAAQGCKYPEGWEGHQAVIARSSGIRTFYRTTRSASDSLYPLNRRCMERYAGLEDNRVQGSEEVEVISLDDFTQPHRPIHFIRADIQCAEIEAFGTGAKTLADVLMIVTEVCFAPLHEGGPLFRDIDLVLSRRGFEFYDIVGLAHRHESPFAVAGAHFWAHCNSYRSHARLLWGDVLYVRMDVKDRDAQQRLAYLAHIYRCHTFAALCIERYADRAAAEEYLTGIIKDNGLDARGDSQWARHR